MEKFEIKKDKFYTIPGELLAGILEVISMPTDVSVYEIGYAVGYLTKDFKDKFHGKEIRELEIP